MTTFAIKRPDGTLVLESVAADQNEAWRRAAKYCAIRRAGPDSSGYSLVEVYVIEKGAPLCKTCNGTGEYRFSKQYGETDFEDWIDSCPVCGGTGAPPAPVHEKVVQAPIPVLVPGNVYRSKIHGLIKYRGLDTFHGQTTFHFEAVGDGLPGVYYLPEVLLDRLAPPDLDRVRAEERKACAEIAKRFVKRPGSIYPSATAGAIEDAIRARGDG